ncbi:head decoration protein [Pseudomonas huanghezhanensis]|uniref:head decoration protein n=1 Tax=Pseudomonas huanghezhanensis TaxID=3002903 RepID=UPI002285D8DC|nr:head decoration protein [Pseudomonas sp. BSw22131]
MNYDTITQGARTAAFLLNEASGERSREQILLLKGATAFPAGQILSKNAAGKYVAFVAPAEGVAAQVAILYEGRDADNTADRFAAGIVRDCEVIESLLIGLTDPAKAALTAAGIILR